MVQAVHGLNARGPCVAWHAAGRLRVHASGTFLMCQTEDGPQRWGCWNPCT